MSTKLDKLLENIDPKRTVDETAKRTDNAINTFRFGTSAVASRQDFEDCVAKFFCHVENTTLRANRPVNIKMDYGRASRLLAEEYGPSGEHAAFEIASTGAEGGLYAVLKAIAKRMSEQYTRNEIAAKVTGYWNGLSNDEKLAAPTEYLKKYGHLLPRELTEGSAPRIRANFMQVLEQHPFMLQRLGRAVR
jgi:hypothetical protein